MRLVRTSIFFLVALLYGSFAFAQDSGDEAAPDTSRLQPGPWKYTTIFALNLSQSAYSSNWSGGDKGSINWVLQGDATAEKQYTHWFNWSNLLQLAYGQTADQVDDPDSSGRIVFDSPEKTTDKIRLESTGRFTLDQWLDPYALLRVESQFSDRTIPGRPISFNPLRFTQSAGVARSFIAEEKRNLISRLGLSVREVFARDFVSDSTDELHSYTNVDGGVEWLTTTTYPLMGDAVVYQGRLLFFYPMFFSGSDDLTKFDDLAIAADPTREQVGDFWKAPEFNFENTFTAAITKHLNVNLYIQWIYQKYDRSTDLDITKPIVELIPVVDSGIRKAGQFKQTLALGLTYQLF